MLDETESPSGFRHMTTSPDMEPEPDREQPEEKTIERPSALCSKSVPEPAELISLLLAPEP